MTFDEFKAKIDIRKHIEQYEELDADGHGSHHKHQSKGGRCLHVNESEQLFNCFHCNAGGSVIDYEMDRLDLDPTDHYTAVESLASQYNLPLPTDRSQPDLTSDQLNERATVTKILKSAFAIYHDSMKPEHRDYFTERGITDEVIDKQQLGYAPPDGAWLFQKMKAHYSKDELLKSGLFFSDERGRLTDRYKDRYIFPYWHKGRPVFSIGRANDKGEVWQKYVKHLVHGDKYPFVSDTAVQHILWGEDKAVNKRGIKIVVVEGIVDAILADQVLGDFVVVSPTTTRISRNQVKRIAKQIGKVQSITFVGDSEEADDREQGPGEQGAIAGAEALRKEWIAIVDANQDIVDGLPKWAEFFDVLLDKKGNPYPRYPVLKIARLRRAPGVSKVDVADYVQQGKSAELTYWVRSAVDLAHNEKRLKNETERFDDTMAFKFLIDEMMLEGEYFAKLKGSDILYHYRGGAYQSGTAEDDIKHYVSKLTDRTVKPRVEADVVSGLTTHHLTQRDDEPERSRRLINCKNGIFDLVTGKLSPHTPDRFLTAQIPVQFDPKATCESFETFLTEIMPVDCVPIVFEIIANAMFGWTHYEKFFIFHGVGANGKSTLMKVFTEFLGKANVSTVPLQDLEDNKFKRIEVMDRLANICPDIGSRPLSQSNILKGFVSGDRVDGERKHQRPVSFTPYATFVFSANELPKSADKTFAFYRRMCIIPFPNVFTGKEADVTLADSLATPETLSGIMNRAIEAAKRLIKQSGFSENETTREAVQQYQVQNDNIVQFVEDLEVEFKEDSVTRRQELFDAYGRYCDSMKLKATSQIKFNKRIPELLPDVSAERSKDPKQRVAIWLNLSYNQQYDFGEE